MLETKTRYFDSSVSVKDDVFAELFTTDTVFLAADRINLDRHEFLDLYFEGVLVNVSRVAIDCPHLLWT